MDEEKETKHEVNNKEDLPTSIIIRNVPKELYEDAKLKSNFADMFTQINENVRIDYLKGFQRVRVVFKEPEHATAAKLLVEHHAFNGVNMKAYFAQNIKLIRRAYQDEEGHLTLPPLEKQFLISPPSSPPVGWTQCVEMAPVVCDFDLMARLAAFTVDDNYELHGGENGQPAIVVTPCNSAPATNNGACAGEAAISPEDIAAGSEEGNDSEIGNITSIASTPGMKVARPRTPRPPMNE